MKSIFEFVNRIIPGDCIKVMQEMPAGSIDFIATDPPYLVGYTNRNGRSVANDDRSEWLMPAVQQMYRVLKYNSFLVSFYGWSALHQQHDTK
jgi:adenine-specific DNA-methyltransferase